jgi:hypothetical protein
MNKYAPVIIVLAFSAACLVMALLMPWAELGFPTPVPGLMHLKETLTARLPGGSDPQVFEYYVYSLFLGLAMLCASMGLWLEGREEAEEVTILPVKK